MHGSGLQYKLNRMKYGVMQSIYRILQNTEWETFTVTTQNTFRWKVLRTSCKCHFHGKAKIRENRKSFHSQMFCRIQCGTNIVVC